MVLRYREGPKHIRYIGDYQNLFSTITVPIYIFIWRGLTS